MEAYLLLLNVFIPKLNKVFWVEFVVFQSFLFLEVSQCRYRLHQSVFKAFASASSQKVVSLVKNFKTMEQFLQKRPVLTLLDIDCLAHEENEIQKCSRCGADCNFVIDGFHEMLQQ